MNYTANILASENKIPIITTSSISMIMALKNSPLWICTRIGRAGKGSHTGLMQNLNVKFSTSPARITAAFKYKGKNNI